MIGNRLSMFQVLLWLVAVVSSASYCVAGESDAGQYTGAITKEPDLVAYWPLQGDLNDAKGKAAGRAVGGAAQFAEGPGGGKSLVLAAGRFVTMGETPALDLKETTVELWFQPNFQPGAGYNPCIIAKRADGDHAQTRFSLHILNDYSALAVWNGQAVVTYQTAEGPLHKGQWYHVALTCTANEMRLYIDGIHCPAASGIAVFNFGQAGRPLSLGSSAPKGQELLDCRLSQVAIYRRALAESDIARHVDAMGWQERRLTLAAALKERIEREKKLRAEQDAQRLQRREELLADAALMARGTPQVYRGAHLRAISLGLGGIGTGSIQINGAGERAVWQIFNNHQYMTVPHSFFAVRVKAADGGPVVRALQLTPVGPLVAMKDLAFRGAYPFGWYEFEDAAVPAKISMEAFNPLVPLDVRSSAIPCAIFNLTAENPTQQTIDVAFLAAQQNAVGCLGDRPIAGRAYPGYGGNTNHVLRDAKGTILHLASNKANDAAGSGDMALLALADGVTGTASWETLDKLTADFAAHGAVTGPPQAGPSAAGTTIDGAIALAFKLAPGEKRTVPFVLTWHFPNGPHGGNGWGGPGNMYANWWPDALAVARELEEKLPELTQKTRLYHDALYASNLPYWLIDRISSQVAVLRSQTCFWTKDGYFGGWEGCCRAAGCCQGNCNHVWHYAQAHGRLFPAIARQMREQEFRFQAPDGGIPHRQPQSFPAFDGQCGAILNSYREHLMSPDGRWLKQHWPKIKRAMDYIIVTWDKDEDGVLAGPQWNTLDGALGGSTSWLGTLYLGALAAAEKMAVLQGDQQAAQHYAVIRATGAKKQDATLFNGEYYIQICDPVPREDYGSGCHIDQVLGQWWAHQLDLGWLYPPEHVRSALKALVRHNFRGNFAGLVQVPRKFVADEDPGLQMITWPKGPKPPKVILYGDEVMTGFEYSAAAAMIQAGLLREGLGVARAIAVRYDGRLRTKLTDADTASWGFSGNPFGDDECGKYYARAMSSWSLLLAAQGFVYDGPAGLIGFRPVWMPEDHASFFTAAEGWGVFEQAHTADMQIERIEVRYGKLNVASLVFELPEKTAATAVTVQLGEKTLLAKFSMSGGSLRVNLDQPTTIQADGALTVLIALRKS